MDKYYTPKIEEFHVGFELELKLHELKEWEKHTFTNKETIDGLQPLIENNKIRVKYLDIEDIESLGWKYLPKLSLRNLTERFTIKEVYKKLNKEHDDTMYWIAYLTYNPDIKRLIIKADIADGSKEEKFYEGLCKNKSELKVILTQLNLI